MSSSFIYVLNSPISRITAQSKHRHVLWAHPKISGDESEATLGRDNPASRNACGRAFHVGLAKNQPVLAIFVANRAY